MPGGAQYPYEWTFSGLQAAALHHLELHVAALELGFTLKDASAFEEIAIE